jgi:hypothetical protein
MLFLFHVLFVFLILSLSVRFDYLVGNSSHHLLSIFYPIVSLSIIISAFISIKRHFFSLNIPSHFRFPLPAVKEIQGRSPGFEGFLYSRVILGQISACSPNCVYELECFCYSDFRNTFLWVNLRDLLFFPHLENS